VKYVTFRTSKFVRPSHVRLRLIQTAPARRTGDASDLGGARRVGPRALSVPREHLRCVLVEPELEDPATQALAEVGTDDVRAFVLENL
jgi:hypothetical protein